MMELKQTVEMMNSVDYKERFKAEYMQVVIRYKKLANMLEKWDKGELPFTPTCPRSTYNMQVRAMTDYITDEWIPVIMAIIGGILGAVGMGIIPDFPATDYITAVAVGMFNGLSATGVNQVIKQTVQKE